MWAQKVEKVTKSVVSATAPFLEEKSARLHVELVGAVERSMSCLKGL